MLYWRATPRICALITALLKKRMQAIAQLSSVCHFTIDQKFANECHNGSLAGKQCRQSLVGHFSAILNLSPPCALKSACNVATFSFSRFRGTTPHDSEPDFMIICVEPSVEQSTVAARLLRPLGALLTTLELERGLVTGAAP